METKTLLISLGKELEAEKDAAWCLSRWLPSRDRSQRSTTQTLHEATLLLEALAGNEHTAEDIEKTFGVPLAEVQADFQARWGKPLPVRTYRTER